MVTEWGRRILTEAELKLYRRDVSGRLVSQVEALIVHQAAHWPMLAQGLEALSQVSLKKIPLGRFDVFAQFNPKRMTSASANVDKVSIQNRPCFLCEANLPPEEKGLAYRDELVVLCNPFPILRNHLSIVHRQHVEQTIVGRLEMLLDVTKDLGPKFFVLYNGPQCGASAPDHFHLQAALREGLPLESHQVLLREPSERRAGQMSDDSAFFATDQYHLNVLIYHSSNREVLARWFDRTIDVLAQLTHAAAEPLINVIATFDDPHWTIYLFPRSKHRPACFYADGDERLLVSPGAIDLAGCVVVPVQAHFQKLHSETMKQIFSEVTLNTQMFSGLIRKLDEES
jgi:hypothetical protein